MRQAEGVVGALVDRMIRRSVRTRFRNVYWVPPDFEIRAPVIFVANHHGWHDGYLMYHLVTRLGTPALDWITEFAAFPLFRFVGGRPFPRGDAAERAATIRGTIRAMREERRSLILFAEAELHRPPVVAPFGRAIELVASRVDPVQVVPVAIRYDMSLHERPEAFLGLGAPVPAGPDLAHRARLAVASRLTALEAEIAMQSPLIKTLAPGTPDVNERWDFRRPRGRT